jgi:hypothetical protein
VKYTRHRSNIPGKAARKQIERDKARRLGCGLCDRQDVTLYKYQDGYVCALCKTRLPGVENG